MLHALPTKSHAACRRYDIVLGHKLIDTDRPSTINQQCLTGGPTRIAKILGNACKDSWDTLKDELFETRIASMPDRVEAVIRAGGGYTKYLEVFINLWTGTMRPMRHVHWTYDCLQSVLKSTKHLESERHNILSRTSPAFAQNLLSKALQSRVAALLT